MDQPKESPNSGLKWLILGCSGCGLAFAVFLAITIGLAVSLTAGAAEAARAHVQQVRDGKVDEAYAATSKPFQASCTLEEFKAYVAAQQVLYAGSDLTLSNRSVEGSTGTISGTTTGGGETRPVSFIVHKAGDVWAVTQVHVEGGGDCPSGWEEAAPEAVSDAPAPDAPRDSPHPEAVQGRAFASTDGLIAVLAPGGQGWRLSQASQVREGTSVTLVKCKSTNPGRFFFFIAKDYTVPPAQVMTAKAIFQQIYMKNYRSMFARQQVLREGPASIGAHDGYEAQLSLTHKSAGEIMKLERLVVQGNHVLLLSAEGAPEAYEGLRAEIGAWFGEARFKTLGQ